MDRVDQATTSYTAAQRAAILARSDERDAYLARILEAEQRGYEQGYDAGHSKGFVAGVASIKRQIRNEVDDFGLEMRRRHVCCGACRRIDLDHRPCAIRWKGCPRCEVRTRETFGLPHRGDYTGGPIGPVETRVWLAGPVVHHHGCTAACYAIVPGWYEPGAAADILATLPGDHAEAITRLRAAELARAA